jgi:hypothetical protein
MKLKLKTTLNPTINATEQKNGNNLSPIFQPSNIIRPFGKGGVAQNL